MSLNGNAWGAAVAAAAQSFSPPTDAHITPAQLEEFWKKICAEHVTHIQNNGVVNTSVPGITPGPSAASGTGTMT